eukprot:g8016.t1
MLQATQKHVKKDLTNRRIQVQDKLLILYTNNLAMVNIQAALLCGFAFSELSNADIPQWCKADALRNETKVDGLCDGMLTTGAVMHSMGLACNLLSVCSATLSSMNGPGLALRGVNPEGDVEKAVSGLYAGHRFALALHMVGMFFYFMGVLSTIWFKFSYEAAVCASVILAVGLAVFAHVYARMQVRFSLNWVQEEEAAKEAVAEGKGR